MVKLIEYAYSRVPALKETLKITVSDVYINPYILLNKAKQRVTVVCRYMYTGFQ